MSMTINKICDWILLNEWKCGSPIIWERGFLKLCEKHLQEARVRNIVKPGEEPDKTYEGEKYDTK